MGRLIPRDNKRHLARFEKIYAPMYGLFLTRHITVYSSVRAPYLHQRIRNARELFEERRYLRAFKAIFDKKETEPSAEVEFGDSFPLSEIQRLVKGNEMYCDETLMNLIARADRSRYEDYPVRGGITVAELSLHEHIVRRHRALSKRFVGK